MNKLSLLIFIAFTFPVLVLTQNASPEKFWEVSYQESSSKLSPGDRLSIKTLSMEVEAYDIKIDISHFVELDLIFYWTGPQWGRNRDRAYCAFFMGKNTTEKLLKAFNDPLFFPPSEKWLNKQATKRIRESNPEKFNKFKKSSAFKLNLEKVKQKLISEKIAESAKPIKEAIVLDKGDGNNEIILYGGERLCSYTKVSNASQLRDFLLAVKKTLNFNEIKKSKLSLTGKRISARNLPASLNEILYSIEKLAIKHPKKYGMQKID